MRTTWTLAVCLAAIGSFAGCGCGSGSDSADVVAVLNGEPIHATQVEAYLEANLLAGWDDGPVPRSEVHQVKSRLFDSFIEECILLAEADRQGIEVTDDELEAYLGARGRDPELEDDAAEAETPPEVGPAERDAARRMLRIQSLVEATIRRTADVSEAEIDAFLQERSGPDGERRPLILRSLLVPDKNTADRLYREIGRRRMTFDEAIAAHEPTPGQASPVEIDLASLPDEVRAAVEKLKAGRVSKPTVVHGDTYLFRVDAWITPDAGNRGSVREWARREILRVRYEEAGETLLDGLRGDAELVLRTGNLPFPYVPDDAG